MLRHCDAAMGAVDAALYSRRSQVDTNDSSILAALLLGGHTEATSATRSRGEGRCECEEGEDGEEDVQGREG